MADRTLTAGTGIALSEATAGQLIVSSTVSTAGLAPLASPALTGTPTAPTATAGTNTTQLATTAFVATAVAAVSGGGPTTITTQSGTTYTFGLGDANTQVSFTNASAVTATIPPNSSVAFPTGTTIELAQLGAGQVTVAPGSGVTLRVAASNDAKAREQYAVAAIRKLATDEWVIFGNLAEAP